MRGRKPKPTGKKNLEGNPGKRPMNEREPQLPTAVADAFDAPPLELENDKVAVVNGTIPAGKYHRLACARHLRDRAREDTPGFPYRFDEAKAERFFRFAEKLRHYKGQWKGQRIILQPWQKFRLGSIFGWVHARTGLRRFRTAYNEVPRKNGKSLEAAIVALYVAFFDGEGGAEGYTIATKRAQAKIVWDSCKELVLKSGLKHRIIPLAANLHRPAFAQKLEPLGADRDSTDGLNPHLIIVDEFHQQKDRGLIDALETATGSRAQPLNFQITTAGNDPVSPCGDQHDYACKILDQVLDDETFFAFIAHADPEDVEGDNWLREETWRKANPNYGVSVPRGGYARARDEGGRDAVGRARVQAKAVERLGQRRRRLALARRMATRADDLDSRGDPGPRPRWFVPEFLIGRRCWLGIDLSSKIDLASIAAVFPPYDDERAWRVLIWALTPEDTLEHARCATARRISSGDRRDSSARTPATASTRKWCAASSRRRTRSSTCRRSASTPGTPATW
jgi:phage terminase large subunit-like protein